MNTTTSKKNIVFSPETYDENTILQFKKRCEKENKNAYLDTPNFALKKDIELLKKLVERTGVGVVANNYYALNLSEDTIVGAGLNVYNSHTAQTFNLPVLSFESSVGEKVEYPLMTLRHCPIKNHANSNCDKCGYCQDYSYVMTSGQRLKLKRKKLSTCTFYLTV